MRVRIPLPPFGTLGIDPAIASPLPFLSVPQPAGIGSLTLPVPNNPVLVGVSIFAQALLVQWPAGAWLTDVTSDRIVR